MILDVKEQGAPAAAPYVPLSATSWAAATFPNHGARVAYAQRALLGPGSDPFLGWLEMDGAAYSVRQRSPFKKTYDTGDLLSRARIRKVCEQWGHLLARAHARADEDLAGRLVPHSVDDEVFQRVGHQRGGFARLVVDVAVGYADQVERDHEALADALD